uniref:Hexose transporter n=1 Tax=[Candida] hispaniensis TaxID=312227 RepID=A0A1N6MC20_9ASCO|nr:hexose transporter [[Candida] hispaniensis]
MPGITKLSLSNKFGPQEDKPEGSVFMAIFVAVFVAFGGVLFGYDTGTISGVLANDYVKEHFTDPGTNEFTSGQSSLITSILSAGTFSGAILAPYVSDTIGRRLGMIFACAIFCVGASIQTASTGRTLIIVGRVIAGAGVGVISSIVPLYQSEVSPKWIRGAVVSAYQLAITIGLLLAAIINYATKNMDNTGSYRIPLGLQMLWAVILVAGLLVLPETPRFWIKKDRHDKAVKSLAFLRRLPENNASLLAELADIQSAFDLDMQIGSSSWIACFSRSNSHLKRIMTGMGLQALQQLTGINFIFYYGTQFFQNAGINNNFTIQIITNVVNVVMTIPGIYFVDKVGRRRLLILGGIICCVSEFIVAIVGTVADSQVSSKVLIAFTCTFIAGFAATWGPIAWVVIGEMFPLRIRAKGVAVCAATNWLFNFVIAYATPYLVDKKPGSAGLEAKVFFIWGACNFLCITFSYFFIYETKGLSLEEVDEMYAAIKYAPHSQKWKPVERNSQVEILEKAENDFVEIEKV